MNRRYFGDALGAVQVERDAGVHAALAEVAVQARPGLVAVAELVVQLLQVPQVVAEPVRVDGGVFPAFPGVAVAGHVRGRAEAGLADRPQLVLPGGVVVEGDVRLVLGVVQRAEHPLGGLVDLLAGVPAELDHEERGALRQLLERLRVHVLELLVVISRWSRPSRAIGWCLRQDARHGVGGAVHAGVAEHDQGPLRQHLDQLEPGAQHGDQRRLAADEQAGDVEAVLGQQRVQVVAGNAARECSGRSP